MDKYYLKAFGLWTIFFWKRMFGFILPFCVFLFLINVSLKEIFEVIIVMCGVGLCFFISIGMAFLSAEEDREFKKFMSICKK